MDTDRSSDPIRVLHVDDEPGIGDLVATYLERANGDFEVTTAPDPETGLQHLETAEVDCVVSDHDMPGMDGVEFLRAVREDHPDLPFVLFTGKGSEEVASEAISAGVTEYMQKERGSDQYLVLANRIRNAVERYRAEQALSLAEERNRRVLETSPAPIVLFGPGRTIDYANAAAADLLGADDPADLVGDAVMGYIDPTCEDLVRDRMHTVLEEREAVPPTEQTYVGVDGREVTVVIATAPVTYDGTDGAQAIMIDVTELKATKRAVAEQRAFIEESLDAIEDLFYVIDRDGNLVRVNARATDLTGYAREEIESMEATDFFREADRERIAESIRDAFESGEESLEAELVDADGETATFEFRKRRLTDDEGEVIGLAGIGRDVTEQRARQRELEQVRNRMERALTATDSIVWEWDARSDAVSFYPAEGPVYGAGVETLDDFLDTIHPADRPAVRTAVETALDECGDYAVDFRVDDDGDTTWLAASGEVRCEDGEPRKILGTAKDVTERKRYEAELERTTEELESLNRVVGHDIRNDMSVILGWAQLLEDHVDDEAEAYLERILASGQHVVELTDVVGDYVQALTGDDALLVEPTPLRSTLETEIWVRREAAPGAMFVVDGEIPDVSVRANEMLTSVFRNLLSNAVQHNDSETPRVEVRAEERDDAVVVTVSDNGPGIPADQRDSVFGKGEKGLDSSGTGIGLYLVRMLVDQFDGDVWIADADEGTTVRVELQKATPDGQVQSAESAESL